MPFFSVIVPVYNVEMFLKSCLDSVLSQDFDNYEILLIDDGSSDTSSIICDQYSEKFNQIKVIHKENGGLSDARNIGLENSSGKYVIFIDSDDYIEKNSLMKFYIEIMNSQYPDLLISRMMQIYPDNIIKFMDRNMPTNIIKSGNKNQIISWVFSESENTWPSVRYIVKKDLIHKNNLKFLKNHLHEDLDWTSQLFLFSQTFSCSEYYWYYHRMDRTGSITTTKNPNRFFDVINILKKNINDDAYGNLTIQSKKMIFERLTISLFGTLRDYQYYSNIIKKQIETSLKENVSLLRYSKSLRYKLFLLFSKIFGFKNGLWIISRMKK